MMMNLPCLRGSCPNFLRPIYHTLSASQTPRRGHAPRKKPMPATALVFMFDCYWSAFICRGTDLLSGRYTISGSCWPFADAVRSGLHHYGFLFQNPVQSLMPPISNSTEFWSVLLIYLCFLCCHRYLCFYRAFDIFQQFLRIISCPCLQDCVNHPQYLAGYHNQWLHLFQWMVASGCVILMQLFEFIRMRHCWLCRLKQPVTQSLASSVADLCLSFMLAGAACHQTHST